MKTNASIYDWKNHVFIIVLIVALFLGSVVPLTRSAVLQSTEYIELEEFRWTKLPVNVLVDMNQWSRPEYAFAVREALDDWVKSIWNYTNTYNDSSLANVNFRFYLNNVNATANYDVLISFAAERIPPGPNTVGLTTYSWDLSTHQPVPPITINITTNSGTASQLFVKNIAMHEFGHALGLGHAGSQNTQNGPELMYYASSRDSVVYPSTLDIYGLTRLYRGNYGQNVYLPPDIPYEMLADGNIPFPQTVSWEDYKKYAPLLVALFLVIVVAAVLGVLSRENRTEESLQSQPPPPP
jgi:predicted Zn-dependent protease